MTPGGSEADMVVRRIRWPRTPGTERHEPPLFLDRNGCARLYRFSVIGPGGDWIAYSDHADALCAAVLEIPVSRWRAFDERARLVERLRYCAGSLVPIQAVMAAENGEHTASLTDVQRAVLFAAPFERRELMPDTWPGMPPLVLLGTDLRRSRADSEGCAKPICDLCGDVAACPHVLVLDPEGDWEMLESLASAGWLQLAEAIT